MTFSDDFARADSSDLGANYTTEDGSIGIVSNAAVSSAPDSIVWAVSAAGGTRSLAVTVSGSSAGAQARLLGGHAPDAFGGPRFVYAEWEFGASDGVLRIYSNINGIAELIHGKFVIPGRGVGVTTRIKLCWGDFNGFSGERCRAQVIDPDTDEVLFATGLVGIADLGPGHGLGTGDLPSGSVTFDDYSAERIGQLCNCVAACAACTTNCVRMPAEIDSDGFDLACGAIAGDHVLSGGTHQLPAPHSLDCVDDLRIICKWVQAVSIGGGLLGNFLLYLHQATDDHWYLTLDVGDASRRSIWQYDLGADPPNCTTFNDVRLARNAACDYGGGFPCDFDGTEALVNSGTLCNGSATSDVCCQGDDISVEFLYATVTRDGVIVSADSPLHELSPGSSGVFFQGTSDPVYTYQMQQLGLCPDGNMQFAILDGSGDPVLVSLVEHACDPFHATGAITVGGHSWTVEVLQ